MKDKIDSFTWLPGVMRRFRVIPALKLILNLTIVSHPDSNIITMTTP